MLVKFTLQHAHTHTKHKQLTQAINTSSMQVTWVEEEKACPPQRSQKACGIQAKRLCPPVGLTKQRLSSSGQQHGSIDKMHSRMAQPQSAAVPESYSGKCPRDP
jgi:hypothetical protein